MQIVVFIAVLNQHHQVNFEDFFTDKNNSGKHFRLFTQLA